MRIIANVDKKLAKKKVKTEVLTFEGKRKINLKA